MTGQGSVGQRFVDAVVSRDEKALRAMLAPDVDFKGLTPGRLWEAADPQGVVDVVLGHWFEESDVIEGRPIVASGEKVGDRSRMSYRFDISNDGGPQVVEQQVYYDADDDGTVRYMRVVCSGFRPRV